MDGMVSMPKIELHAHLNGSIRDSTLFSWYGVLLWSFLEIFEWHVVFVSCNPYTSIGVLEVDLRRHAGLLYEIRLVRYDYFGIDLTIVDADDRSLSEVFKLFDVIHILTTDHKTVTRISKEVIEDFAADNVVYLELRTTPKRNDSKGMSKRSYIEAVLEGIRSVNLVEVDLSHKLNMDTSAYAHAMNDVCDGTGSKKIYVRLLLSIDRRETAEAATETVKLALEMRDLGVVGIDLSGNPAVVNGTVEICLTSNIRTETIASVDVHHFGLGKTEMFQLAEKAIEFHFCL
ncbi:UNVERIFIED_CONTAM: N6-mAMP deaminase [Sesamum angustifolium]|uniref:N6-mAMP deaminase n=1 Tax=Sesamum angustifolium TaxID=2727405 RepID=A0AAW2PB21_9LAMI